MIAVVAVVASVAAVTIADTLFGRLLVLTALWGLYMLGVVAFMVVHSMNRRGHLDDVKTDIRHRAHAARMWWHYGGKP